jgi:hypothetical protein
VSKNATVDAIKQIFSEANKYNAYGKKLMLIENCIYGVDIQPIAIQICKLHFATCAYEYFCPHHGIRIWFLGFWR